jgi:hypothetical protein
VSAAQATHSEASWPKPGAHVPDADLHLAGQVCHVTDRHDSAGAVAIFACGCRALVPTSELEPAYS